MQDKKFVYVLGDSSKVKNTEITVFPLDNGKQYVVTSGLKPGEQVVVEGVATLRDGMPIQHHSRAVRSQSAGDDPADATGSRRTEMIR